MLGPEGLGFFSLRSDAKRFECGSYNIPGILAFGAALETSIKANPTSTPSSMPSLPINAAR